MKYVSDIIKAVRAEPSTNKKIEILKTHKNNATLKQVCYLTYNNHIQFYIRQIPEYRQNITSATVSLEQILKSLVESLASRKFTGKKATYFLQELLEASHPEDAEVLELIIARDLDCGASGKTFNKIWPDLIPIFDPMACEAYKNFKDHIKFPALCQEKMDGMRNVVIFGKENKYEIRTRNGLPFDELGAFQNMRNSIFYNNIVLDGEFMVLDDDGNYLPRKKGNGICTKAIKGTLSEEESKRMVFVLWDVLTGDEFKNGGGRTTLERFERAEELYNQHLKNLPNVRFVNYITVNSHAEISKNFEKLTASGGEGVIVKNYDQVWENKRSKGWLKVKLENVIELRIDQAIEGLAKYRGQLGAFALSDKSGLLNVKVGSGLSDEQRIKLWEDRENLVGKIISIKYNEIMVDESDNSVSLFLPIFVEIREDKNESDDIRDLI